MRRSTVPARRRSASLVRRRMSPTTPRRHMTLAKKRTAPLRQPKRRIYVSRRRMVRPVVVKPSGRPPDRPIQVIHKWPYRWWPRRTIVVRDGGGLPGSFDYLPSNIVPRARHVLRKLGLSGATWANRLRRGGHRLVDFINRFYRVDGFDEVIRLYFDGAYQRRTAQMLMRLAHQLVEKNGPFPSNMRFYRTRAIGPDGRFEPAVILVHKTLHHLPLPWSQLGRTAIRRTMVWLARRFDQPKQVRLIFDRSLLPYGRSDMISRLHHMLYSPNQARRRWVVALPRIVQLQH
jgi:hypothetical protein